MVPRSRSLRLTFVVATCLVLGLSTAWAISTPALPPGIPAPERVRLERVADGAAVSTSVATEPFVSRRDIFEYLLDHPEFATHVTRSLRMARYRIWRTAEGLYLDDGWGASGYFTLVHTTDGTRVMYARGAYRQTALPTVQGEAVAMIHYDVTPTDGGRDMVRATVSGFVKLDSGVLTLATKLAHPIAQHKADLEARRLMRVFAKVSRAINDNPGDVYEKVRKSPDVPPRELEEFGRLLNRR